MLPSLNVSLACYDGLFLSPTASTACCNTLMYLSLDPLTVGRVLIMPGKKGEKDKKEKSSNEMITRAEMGL